MTTENNITHTINNLETQMSDINCLSSTDCSLQPDINDIKGQKESVVDETKNKKLVNPSFHKDTEPTFNEKEETTLKNSDLNEPDASVDCIDDQETSGYSCKGNDEVNDEVYYDEDMLSIYLDESIENSPNELLENVTETPKNGVNAEIKSVQDWSTLQDALEEGEIMDSESAIKDWNTFNEEKTLTQNWYTMPDKKAALNKNINPMQFVFGLICMSFKKGPYEFTLANMTHYISGKCDIKNQWLKNLDSYIKQLNITDLHVIGHKQANLIARYVYSARIRVLYKHFLPDRENSCPNCFRYGCSKYKVACILHHNFKYGFKIPCTFVKTF